MSKIFIVTGKIKTGKTTRLMKWVNSQNNIDGILQPVVDGKRYLYHIKSRTLKQFETDSGHNIISIGNYKFFISSFEWAKNIIDNACRENLSTLIIDEIGPLELKGSGLEPVISKILREKHNLQCDLIFVVREEILDKFLEHYNLSTKEYEILNIE